MRNNLYFQQNTGFRSGTNSPYALKINAEAKDAKDAKDAKEKPVLTRTRVGRISDSVTCAELAMQGLAV